MQIQQKSNSEISITLSSKIDPLGLQSLIDYAKYLEATSKSKAKQSDADQLADEVNSDWWENNKSRFVN